MHGFINSPALAKLVALQLADEQVQQRHRTRPRRARTPLRVRFLARRTARSSTSPAQGARVSPAGRLAEEAR